MRKNGPVANPSVSAGGRPDSESKVTCPGSPRHQRDRESLLSDSCSILGCFYLLPEKKVISCSGLFRFLLS